MKAFAATRVTFQVNKISKVSNFFNFFNFSLKRCLENSYIKIKNLFIIEKR